MTFAQETSFSRAFAAAALALTAAQDECLAAQLNPEPHYQQLSGFVEDEVRLVLDEMGRDRRSDPLFLLRMRDAKIQDIYFADAGRRAAHSLLNDLHVPHALLTTRRG